MRVWVTRSQPGADRQAAALRVAGFEPLIAPVTGVETTGAKAPGGSFERLVYLSEHAVRYAGSLASGSDAAVYAVGAATARALAAVGVDAICPLQPGSDGLLELPELADVAGERLLIVAGEDGRKDLGAELRARGARVREHLCYRRVRLEVAPDQLHGVDVILVGSQDGFAAVARLWFDAEGPPAVPVLTPSGRVAALAESLGFRRVLTAEGPSDDDFVSSLKRLQSKS